MIRIPEWRENHFRINTSIRRKKTDCESLSQGLQKLSILVGSFKKNYSAACQVYQFHQNGLAGPYDER